MDVHDWWNRTRSGNGAVKLSSRRLVLFLEHLPEEAAFRLAATDDWSHTRKLMASTVNELRIMRAESAVQAGGEFQEPQLIKTPSQLLSEQFDSEQKQAIRTGIMSQLKFGQNNLTQEGLNG